MELKSGWLLTTGQRDTRVAIWVQYCWLIPGTFSACKVVHHSPSIYLVLLLCPVLLTKHFWSWRGYLHTYIYLLTFFGWRMCWCVDVCVLYVCLCTGQCDRSCSHWVLWQWTTCEFVSLLTDITYPQVPFASCHHELYLWTSWIVYLACCKFTLCACGLGYWQVHNFVSLGGPHAGTASVPGCAVRLILGFTEAPQKNYYFLCLFLL